MGYDVARGADNKIHIHVGHRRMIYYYPHAFLKNSVTKPRGV